MDITLTTRELVDLIGLAGEPIRAGVETQLDTQITIAEDRLQQLADQTDTQRRMLAGIEARLATVKPPYEAQRVVDYLIVEVKDLVREVFEDGIPRYVVEARVRKIADRLAVDVPPAEGRQ